MRCWHKLGKPDSLEQRKSPAAVSRCWRLPRWRLTLNGAGPKERAVNPWVERALMSVAASAVSTAMWITTAKNPKGSKRRRRGKRKRSGKAAGTTDSSPVPRSPGAQAVRDHENGHRDGMSAGEFLENLQRSGARNAARVAQVRAWLKNEPSGTASANEVGHRDKASEKASHKEKETDSVLAEAKKAARKQIQKEMASRTGLSQASEKWQATSASLKEAGGKLSQSVKQKMPDNWSQGVEEAGRNVKDALSQAGRNVREGLENEGALGEKMDQGIRHLGRWIQGPGAPRAKAEGEDASIPADGNRDWVEARMPDEAHQADEQPELTTLHGDGNRTEKNEAPSEPNPKD